MAVTAEQLWDASGLQPAHLGEEIVDPSADDAAQKQQALDYLTASVLPVAKSEVSVPFFKASNGYDVPLPDDLLLQRYPRLTSDQRAKIGEELSTLYDGAVLSFGRSELSKRIASDANEYDEDSDEDRKTARDQLRKLLDLMNDIIVGINDPAAGGITPLTISLSDLPPHDEYGGVTG
jgi:hypothetical protein